MRSRSAHRRRLLSACALAVLLALAVLGLPSATNAVLTSSVSATGNVGNSGSWCRYTNAVISDNPYLYWRLDETTIGAGLARDRSGNGRIGTMQPAITTNQTPGAINCDTDAAIGVNGNGNWVNPTSATAMAAPANVSVEAWVKTNAAGGGRIAGYSSLQTGASGGNQDRVLYVDGTGKISFAVFTGNTTRNVITSSSTYTDNLWHHVVGTLSSTAGITLYVDGVQVAANSAVTSGYTGTGFFRIGSDSLTGWSNAGNSSLASGYLDEFAVYLTALSATQVANHYAARNGNPVLTCGYADTVASTNPDFFYRMEEAAGPSALDSGARSSTGTYSGTYTLGAAGAFTGPNCASSKAMAATSAAVAAIDIPTAAQVAGPGPNVFTLSGWFKTTTSGKLVGFQGTQGATATNYDRMTWVGSNGQLYFGVYSGAIRTVNTTTLVNDGNWHYFAATMNSSGMALYLDGAAAITRSDTTTAQNYGGWWRVGGGQHGGSWPNPGASPYQINGSIDEMAIWNTRALTAAQVAAQYAARTN